MHGQVTGSLEDAPLNGFHKRLTVYSSAAPFLDGYLMSIVGVVMVQATGALRLSVLEEGLVAASALIGMFLGGFIGGVYTDRLGRKTLYLLDLLCMAVFSLLQFWVDGAWQLIGLRLLIGVAIGADHPLATSLLAEFLPRKHRGPILAGLVMMWFVGAAAAYIVGELLLQTGRPDAWRWALASAVVPAAAFLLMRAGTPESARWLLNRGRAEEADAVIRKVYGPGYSIANLPETRPDRYVSVWSLFHSVYGKRIFFTTMFWSCAIIPLFAVYAFAPRILQALGLTGNLASWGSVAITLIFTAGCYVAMKLIDVLGRRRLLIHSMLWSGLALSLLGAFSNASATIVLILFGAYALFIGGAQVLTYVYPNELFPTEVRGSAMGLATSLSRIGAAVGTYLVPIALTSIGIGQTMYVAAAISFVGLGVSWLMAPETRSMDLHTAGSMSH